MPKIFSLYTVNKQHISFTKKLLPLFERHHGYYSNYLLHKLENYLLNIKKEF